MNKGDIDFVVDEEFERLLPPLSEEERATLEKSILTEGCRDPVVIWMGKNTLLDGHNRIDVCDHHGKSYEYREVSLPDRDAAKRWIFRNARGRRNLTPEKLSYIRGAEYELVKRQDLGHGDQKSGGNNCPPTAEELAKEYHVAPRTIKSDAAYARDIDHIGEVAGYEAKRDILSGDIKLTRNAVKAIAGADEDEIAEAFSDEDDPKDAVKKLAKREIAKTKKPPKPPKWDLEKCISEIEGVVRKWKRVAQEGERVHIKNTLLQAIKSLEKESKR